MDPWNLEIQMVLTKLCLWQDMIELSHFYKLARSEGKKIPPDYCRPFQLQTTQWHQLKVWQFTSLVFYVLLNSQHPRVLSYYIYNWVKLNILSSRNTVTANRFATTQFWVLFFCGYNNMKTKSSMLSQQANILLDT